MNRLVLFDLDNTLLDGDSDVEWPRFLMRQGVLDTATYNRRNDEFYAQYQAGTLDIHAFLAFQLAPLAQRPRAQLDAWHARYMVEHIEPLLRQPARQLVAGHQAEGALVVIITATNRFVTAPIARALGVEHLIATELEEVDGLYTGKSTGLPSFKEGKIQRLHDWLASRGQTFAGFDDTWFYSDSHNDLPLLKLVSHPITVNPDPTLHAYARAHGWPVLDLHGRGL
jgi:HAD superfamily hydrolase (TIGR01490 family)